MKTIQFIITLLIISSMSHFSFAQSVSENNIGKTITMQQQPDTLVYAVYGMDCPGCAGGLEKQVNKIEAVASSDADWLNQRLTLVLKQDSTLDKETLENRVKKANFTLGDKMEAEDEKEK